jgi:hypothetical protein
VAPPPAGPISYFGRWVGGYGIGTNIPPPTPPAKKVVGWFEESDKRRRYPAELERRLQTQWAKFAKDEDDKFLELAPEMANKDTSAKVAKQAAEYLEDVGFSSNDISSLWEGRVSVSLRDHRLQLVIRDALRYREAKSAVPKAKAPAPAARVQRPGTPAERASDSDVRLGDLNKQLNTSGKWKDGAELLIAMRNARR